MSLIGGNSMADVVGGILKHLLTVRIQREYNWYGQKGKKALGQLQLANVVRSKCMLFFVIQ